MLRGTMGLMGIGKGGHGRRDEMGGGHCTNQKNEKQVQIFKF